MMLDHKNGYGYGGGKIREKYVEQIFKKEGRLIVQGSLESWAIPQSTTDVGLRPIPQPIALQLGPMESMIFKQQITSNVKPSMTGTEIEQLSLKVTRQRMEQFGLSMNGTV
jgi:hypothetical protein